MRMHLRELGIFKRVYVCVCVWVLHMSGLCFSEYVYIFEPGAVLNLLIKSQERDELFLWRATVCHPGRSRIYCFKTIAKNGSFHKF